MALLLPIASLAIVTPHSIAVNVFLLSHIESAPNLPSEKHHFTIARGLHILTPQIYQRFGGGLAVLASTAAPTEESWPGAEQAWRRPNPAPARVRRQERDSTFPPLSWFQLLLDCYSTPVSIAAGLLLHSRRTL